MYKDWDCFPSLQEIPRHEMVGQNDIASKWWSQSHLRLACRVTRTTIWDIIVWFRSSHTRASLVMRRAVFFEMNGACFIGIGWRLGRTLELGRHLPTRPLLVGWRWSSGRRPRRLASLTSARLGWTRSRASVCRRWGFVGRCPRSRRRGTPSSSTRRRSWCFWRAGARRRWPRRGWRPRWTLWWPSRRGMARSRILTWRGC